ncbi:MAG: type II toxin-antitoxin system HicB family antitoxin [Spirochaeta sp.]|jgi:predicted RNase H-like HicB family nuclease|nr:type II toxin-antitoxin system HicB family antitoxin [Spirochaeta sp.]
MNDTRHGYRVFWYPDDATWVARCVELPSISGIGDSPEEALAEAQTAVDLAVTSLLESGEPLPPVEPLAEPKKLWEEHNG